MLQSKAPASGASKREELTFSEDGWARGSSTAYTYAPAAAPILEEPQDEQQYDAEGDYAEQEGFEGEEDYSHYYGAEEPAKDEEAEVDGYAEEGEEADVSPYEYSYETGEEAEATHEPDEDGLSNGIEGEDDSGEYGVDLEAEEEEAEGGEEAAETAAHTQSADGSLEPYSLAQIAQRVQVRHVEGKGRCLYTRSALDPGEIIFIEKPVLVAVPSLNPELWDLLTTLNNEQAFDLPPIWHLAALCSMTTLGEEGYKICMDKWVPETDREPSEDVLRVCSYIEGDIDAHVYERMLLVWRYNSFGHHTETQGLVLYNRISMMAHSCRATACWHYGEDDAFVLRARVALKRGDEITISYIGDDELFKSTNIRRDKVQGWLFTCQCVRCADPVDPARGFRCPTCGNGSMFFKTEDEVRACST